LNNATTWSGACLTSPTAATGQSITVSRASDATVTMPDGSVVTCSANQLRVNGDGRAVIEPGRTNYFLNSASPANQNVTLATGAHCAWTVGGSLTVTAGTGTATGLPCAATAACQCLFTVTGAGTFAVSVSGGPTHAQVENGEFQTSRIVTAGTTVARAADNISFANPLVGSAYCLGVEMAPPGSWSAYPGVAGVMGLGAIGAANSSQLYFISANALRLDVRDSGGGQKITQYTFQELRGERTAAHVVHACNNNGSLLLYLNGTSVGSVSGAGTGIVSTQPGTAYIGSVANAAHAGVQVTNVTLTKKAAVQGRTKATTFVAAIGDSITAGSGTTAYPYRLGVRLGANYQIANEGNPGYTASQVLGIWRSNVRGRGYDRIVVLAGVNDVREGATAAATFASLQTIYEEALADGLKVVAVTVLPWKGYGDTPEELAETDALNASIRSYAGGANYTVVDGYADFDDGTGTMKSAYDSGDHLHPNAAGFDRLAELVKEALP
ncbi:MAG: SGNH/GDSL hydrolase family protein, partial [Myxococcales bacterium]